MDRDEKRFLADTYRQATFDLLAAARRVRDAAADLSKTRTRAVPSAAADLAEAREIMATLAEAYAVVAALPDVPITRKVDR